MPMAAGAQSFTPVSLDDVEREHIIRTLKQVRGNKAGAARLLGISRRSFYRQLERHGLHEAVPREAGFDGPEVERSDRTDAGADLHPSTGGAGALSKVEGPVGPGPA
jgi:hypothetical protein